MFRIILVLFVILNLHFAILNFSKLILDGVESNPGQNTNVFRKSYLPLVTKNMKNMETRRGGGAQPWLNF